MMLLLLTRRREHDGRQMLQPFVALHLGQHVETAQVGHHEIEQHEPDVVLAPEHLERLTTVVDEGDPEGPLLELHLDDASDVRLVIGDERMRQGNLVHGLDEGRDVLAIATQLEEELPDVGLGTNEHEQDGVAIEDGHDREPVAMLEDGGRQRAAIGRSAELVSRPDDRRDSRRQIFCVEPGYTLSVDQQPVTSQDDRRFDTFTLSNRRDQVPNARHSRSSQKWSRSIWSRGRKSSEDIGLSLIDSLPILRSAFSHFLTQLMPPTRLPRVALVAVVALATLAVACGDLTRPKASTPNLQLDYSVYALTGTPVGVTNAINFFAGPARVDPAFSFDVALDLDSTGKILVYPVRAVAGPLAGTIPTRVGLQKVTGPFESVRSAPNSGLYDTITVQPITTGQVVTAEIIQQTSLACVYSLQGSAMYAKFVVDSVDMTKRRLFVRHVVDGNCGFRSLVPDSIPTS